METWIINLPKDTERRVYMQSLCKAHGITQYEFVDAVYGKSLSLQELSDCFDLELSFKRYGRKLNVGEIGCTLSHYQCYKRLCKSDDHVALILEDDITVLGDLAILQEITQFIDTPSPTIVFLSGDYWYTKKRNLNCTSVVNVYDAVGSYAYLINKAAAKLILTKNQRPSCTADNWSLYRRQGVRLYAVYPYVIDANIEEFASSILQSTFGEKRKNMPWSMRIPAYCLAFIKKILVKSGHFVSKIRK